MSGGVIYAGEKQDSQRRTGENKTDKMDAKGEKEIPVKKITGRRPGRGLQTKADEQGALGEGVLGKTQKGKTGMGLIKTDEKERAGTEKTRKRARKEPGKA